MTVSFSMRRRRSAVMWIGVIRKRCTHCLHAVRRIALRLAQWIVLLALTAFRRKRLRSLSQVDFDVALFIHGLTVPRLFRWSGRVATDKGRQPIRRRTSEADGLLDEQVSDLKLFQQVFAFAPRMRAIR
jgi:hypothetical protein